MATPVSLTYVLDTLNPVFVIVLASLLGSTVIILYEIISDGISWRSLKHLPIGLVAAIIAAAINEVPGNSELLLNCLVASLGSATIIYQYSGLQEKRTAILSIAEKTTTAQTEQEQISEMLRQLAELQNLRKATPSPMTAATSIVSNE